MIKWIQRLLMGRKHREELEALYRYRILMVEYRRWLGSMPDVALVLENLQAMAESRRRAPEFPGRPARNAVHIGDLRTEMAQLRYSTLGQEPKF